MDDLVFRVAPAPGSLSAMPSQSPENSTAPSISPSDAPTFSPTEDTDPPSIASTNLPTQTPTRADEYYDELPPNSASSAWNYAVVGASLLLIGMLLTV